jgi:hypothetical protein
LIYTVFEENIFAERLGVMRCKKSSSRGKTNSLANRRLRVNGHIVSMPFDGCSLAEFLETAHRHGDGTP